MGSRVEPVQVGLTGSIGMGKSAVARHFQSLGFPVFDADAAVHELYRAGGKAVPLIATAFPEAIVDGAVSRPALSKLVLQDAEALKKLEGIVHPLVRAERMEFFDQATQRGAFMVLYDIPLLFENPAAQSVDYAIVASADADTQRQRVLARPQMTPEKLASILAKQMPDADKRARGDFVVLTDLVADSYAPARHQIAKAIEAIVLKESGRWSNWVSSSSVQEKSESSSSTSSSSSSSADKIRSAFDLVLFDLDDTLVPVLPPLQAAAATLVAHMESNMPEALALAVRESQATPDAATAPVTTSAALTKALSRRMHAIAGHTPSLAHDLSEIRRLALTELILEATPAAAADPTKGVTPTARLNEEYRRRITEGMSAFLETRSLVEAFLYSDAQPCLRFFRDLGLRMGVVTNGNANLTKFSLDGTPCFDEALCLTSGDTGALKPSIVPFLAALQRSGVAPNRVLFVGDQLDKDVRGANLCGMCSLWLDRAGQGRADGQDPPSIHLHTLEPAELEAKILLFLADKDGAV